MTESWLRDLRFGARALRRQPGFSLAAIATLALGIGAATAIFSVAYGVSLRPLPYPEPDRLVRIYEANPATGQPRQDVSLGTFHEWREGVPAIESAAVYGKPRRRFLVHADRDPITSMGVSPAFFDVLATRPTLGRGFKPEREYTRFTIREVILTHAAWRRLFNEDRGAVGRFIRFADDDDPFEVVGILPASFQFTQPVDVFQPKIVELPLGRALRNWRYDRMIARLRPGATIDQAGAELGAVSLRLAREFPASNRGWGATIEPLRASIVGSFARATWLLLAAVVVVLVVACLNVGGLLVARAVARERETAVRVALGAGSWRLIRLWLAEAAIVAISGGALGVLIAWSGVSALRAAAPPGIPRLDAVAVDLHTLAVAATATILATIFFAAAPLGTHRDRSRGLHVTAAGAGEAPSRHATRTALLIAQCAGAATLVVLAAMLTRSFARLVAVDLGWNASGVLSLSTSPPIPSELRRPWFRFVEWSDRLVERLEATPGVARAAITTQVPLSPEPYPATIARGRGRTATDDAARWPGVSHHVTDGYFDVMGIRVLDGRTFGAEDRFTAAQVNQTERVERGVAIVTESTARTLWPGQNAIGQPMWLPDIDNVNWREVVGVVADIHFHAVGEAPALHVFVPWTQSSTGRPQLVVRSSLGAGAAPTVRDIVESVEPGTRIDNVATLDALVARATAQPRFTTRVVAAFGGLALLLAAVGVYGTLSYVVGARTREFGIRVALGASRMDITWRTLSRAVVPAALGGFVGVGLAIALARVFRALLFGIEPADARSIVAGGVLLLAIVVAAALGPARRAARVDPVQALRAE